MKKTLSTLILTLCFVGVYSQDRMGIITKLPLWDLFKNIQEYPQYFDRTDYWLTVCVCVCILVVVALVGWFLYITVYDYYDKKSSTKKMLHGQLIDKKYIGEQISFGTGTAIIPNSNGGIGVGIVSTNSHSPEEFLFFIKLDVVYKIKVSMQENYLYSIGDRVLFEITIGGLSKKELSYSLA